MWIFLSDAMLSIVDKQAHKGYGAKGVSGSKAKVRRSSPVLLVRARVKGDIERIFGSIVKVTESHRSDYRFRAEIPRATVAKVLAEKVLEINYGNFKDSVHEHDRKGAYTRVWGSMNALQQAHSGTRWSDYPKRMLERKLQNPLTGMPPWPAEEDETPD